MTIINWEKQTYPNGVTVWSTRIGRDTMVFYGELDNGTGHAGIFALDDSDFFRSKATADKDTAEALARRLATRTLRAQTPTVAVA